ncbi:AAA family ATPase [Burkholderia pseudomultivorans]|uniref:AAA family ATPase n=1 Tax=Burkholderia pseudomultivorans TaxID=1207504 RepID=UPI00188E767B|nr:AAA family ATPase [Burkholderia pseudomultivorans]MBF5010274.1 AAA family ATPase [Burkholderia pseudomultivorans]
MIKTIEIRNYKSIDILKLDLGRVNVFIGENGAGKSNILEAIGLAGAASAKKLDNEFLASRGIRVTQAQLMRPAFDGFEGNESISITVGNDSPQPVRFTLSNDNAAYSQWQCDIHSGSASLNLTPTEFPKIIKSFVDSNQSRDKQELQESVQAFTKILFEKLEQTERENSSKEDLSAEALKEESRQLKIELPTDNLFAKYLNETNSNFRSIRKELSDFIIYSPENTSLRIFEREGQIEPLGINGEGLLKLLRVLSSEDLDTVKEIKASLSLFGWFKDFNVVDEGTGPSRMEIEDKYLADGRTYFDQRSANEGFLFLVFYFSLFSSRLTPTFFGVDNVDASLNPKLCQKLALQLVKLAKKHEKQVILTTHNPAILDGLNLEDDEQRLFAVSRNSIGYTKVTRIHKPKQSESSTPIRLSEAFLRGSIGGLPKGF